MISNIDEEQVISYLGEITPDKSIGMTSGGSTCVAIDKPVVSTESNNMLAYTINISPDHRLFGSKWGDKKPDVQVGILQRVHKRLCLEMRRQVDDDNGVAFEFTKSGEVHSHGYLVFKDKYTGYERWKTTVRKALKGYIYVPFDNFVAVVTKWCDNAPQWIKYISKDLSTSGYKLYKYDWAPEYIKVNIIEWIVNEENKLKIKQIESTNCIDKVVQTNGIDKLNPTCNITGAGINEKL
uniref:hypothetical protein n=1 Tax=Limnohabitans sp. TaxID=1907725 RepID=UPI004047DE9E